MTNCSHATSVFTDPQLVSLQGDQHEAFDELIRRHRHKCNRFASSILRDREWKKKRKTPAGRLSNIAQFHGSAEFSTWLLRIVENQCLMLIRQRRRAQFVYLDGREPGGGWSRPTPRGAPIPKASSESRKCPVLRTEITRSALPRVILVRDVDELPMQDLAAKLGITVPAKSRLLRARGERRWLAPRHCTQTGSWTPHDLRRAHPRESFINAVTGTPWPKCASLWLLVLAPGCLQPARTSPLDRPRSSKDQLVLEGGGAWPGPYRRSSVVEDHRIPVGYVAGWRAWAV